MYLSGAPTRPSARRSLRSALGLTKPQRQARRQAKQAKQAKRSAQRVRPFGPGLLPVSLAPASASTFSPTSDAAPGSSEGGGASAPVMTYSDSNGNEVEVNEGSPEDAVSEEAAPGFSFPPAILIALAIGAFFLFKKGR